MNAYQLKEWRTRCGFTRQEAADQLNMPISTLHGYLGGRSRIPGPVERLADMIETQHLYQFEYETKFQPDD